MSCILRLRVPCASSQEERARYAEANKDVERDNCEVGRDVRFLQVGWEGTVDAVDEVAAEE